MRQYLQTRPLHIQLSTIFTIKQELKQHIWMKPAITISNWGKLNTLSEMNFKTEELFIHIHASGLQKH